MIEEAGGFKRRTDLEKPYGFYLDGTSTEPIVADSETELIKKVAAAYNTFQEQVKGQTVIIKNALKEDTSSTFSIVGNVIYGPTRSASVLSFFSNSYNAIL